MFICMNLIRWSRPTCLLVEASLGSSSRFHPSQERNTRPSPVLREPDASNSSPCGATRLGMASAMVIEFPTPREGVAAPFSDETAIFDAAMFELWLPQIAVDAGEMGMLAEELAEIAPVHSDAFGPETKIGETLLPRA